MKVSPEIEQLTPYIPGKPISEVKREYGLSQICKLASNEAPYGPSSRVLEAIKAELLHLNRYPDPQAHCLTQTFSKHYEVAPENLVCGNGSNELIDLLIRTFCTPGQRILTSQAAFIAYKICAQAARVKVVETPMVDMCFDLQAIKKEVQKKDIRIVFIANPNNPTGTYLDQEQMVDFLNFMKSYPETLVVIDEAYTEFVRVKDYPEGLKLFHQYCLPNLVIVRTLSKVYGLAGIRLGVLIAPTLIANYIHRVRNPFNVNHLAQVAGVAAILDQAYVKQLCQLVWKGLDHLYTQLEHSPIKYWESQANFVLLDFGKEAFPIYQSLLQKGFILRPVHNYGLKNCLRLTIGLPEENKQIIQALIEVVTL